MAEGSATKVLPRQHLLDLVNSRYISQAICVAAKAGIADCVPPDSSVNVGDIASQLDCHEVNLYRLMSFLASYGIFEEKANRHFAPTELSLALRKDSPTNCHNILVSTALSFWPAMTHMGVALEKGNDQTPFERMSGETFYDYLANRPEEQRLFDSCVASQTSLWQSLIPDHYDFSQFSSVVDVAGGKGSLLKAILSKNPTISATLFEKPSTIRNVLPELLADDKFKDRFRAVDGDFLDNIGVEADLFTIAITLHCFSDQKVAIILRNIAEAMKKRCSSRLLIIETDVDSCLSPNKPSFVREFDMHMMVLMGGRERCYDDWDALLSASGLRIKRKTAFPENFMGLECELSD